MSNKTGPVAAINSDETEVRERMARGEARRKAFAAWMREEVDETCESVSKTDNALVQHALWRAFTAGERHGRAQLNAILSHGRREA
jgi:hypothetical protein